MPTDFRAGNSDKPESRHRSDLPDLLDQPADYTMMPESLVETFGADIRLPDGGRRVKRLADLAPGGAFDPRDLEAVPALDLGYRAKWTVLRYSQYGLDWDITGLRLESLDPDARNRPWAIIIHGGSANFYEFLVNLDNEAGLGQYLAQKVNVLLVTIPGNFKYGGWSGPFTKRAPQFLLDTELPAEEVKLRNALYTNIMQFAGLKRLILRETCGDIVLVGHSTSGELVYLAHGDPELSKRLKRRFLGWGSGGPSNLRKEWEETVGKRERSVAKLAGFPPMWELRARGSEEYAAYVGPLNSLAKPGLGALQVAEAWLERESARRPQFKQPLLDMEHRGMVELRGRIVSEIRQTLTGATVEIDLDQVLGDLFASNDAPLTGYDKMLWSAGKWDQGHWHKTDPEKARERLVSNQFRDRNPDIAIRTMVFDMPMTHYGHLEKPRQLAGFMLETMRWLAA
ncbi:hypothetical protein [Labrenzia sp. OB1]|uniref:hypothetical protein n=1 Tax=Labrenzia sp. OB1 TaxID=1561204 RepID=UPI0007B1E1DE|nr:hypothetical protein [Labrenzia sp. OB1]KZM49526.1 hypothetical protein OA90_13595 [Labrenzia sp. OB1]